MRISIPITPFVIPRFAQIEVPGPHAHSRSEPYPSVPLSEVDADVLSDLCDRFRKDVFDAAGKQDPRSMEDING